MDIYEQIQKARIMPLVTLDDPGQARIIGEALTECGLPVVEVTFRTDAAEEAIRIFKQEFPHILVGAGTVLCEEMADKAIRAGAAFILAPGINPEIVKYCQRRSVPVFPGCMTPTDLDMALRLGVDVVKIFPFVPMGGLSILKAMSAPFGKLRFVVTGGINNNNLKEFLEYEKIISCGGSWLINKKRLQEKDVEGLIADIKETMACLPAEN